MPTMSSSLDQPLVTPSTALKTSARVSPCRAALSSPERSRCSVPSVVFSVIPSATSADTLPLGPSTRTVLPSTLYFTPAGSGIGFFPIRDIEILSFNWLASPEELYPSFHCSRTGPSGPAADGFQPSALFRFNHCPPTQHQQAES